TAVEVEEVAGLRRLGVLGLSHSGITDQGLKLLAGLKNLQVLHLGGNRKVTDAGGQGLRELRQLRALDPSFTALAHQARAGPGGLARLESVALGKTGISDEGLKQVARLQHLRALDVRNTKVTDVGLQQLAGLTRLQALDLYATKVTDAGLKELAGLKQMQTLYL